MGNSNYSMDIFICSNGVLCDRLISMLFPRNINNRERYINKDEMYYLAKIYRGDDHIMEIINDINDNCRNKKRNNVILCFCQENKNTDYNISYWTNLINQVSNNIREVNYPLIILIKPFERFINFDQIFQNHKDKRTITVLRTTPNDCNENIELNYRLILSLLWEKDLYLNQKEIKPNKNSQANIFRINNRELTSSINILLSGYTRKGKSTFLNLIFDKLVSRESPQGFPLTKCINEYSISFNNNNNENNLFEIYGGLTIYDSPGFIEGTNENHKKIKVLINELIERASEMLDTLHYVFFFLQPGVNYQNSEDIFSFLNSKVRARELKVIFIINRDMPRNGVNPNVTKETLIQLFEDNYYNNLIIDNGENILEVDLIEGSNANNNRMNKIFNYIYNDLINNNAYINNPQLVQNMYNENELVSYLRNNSSFYTRISNPNDIINRSKLKSETIINFYTGIIFGVGFSPIPLIDIPIFFFFLSLMMIRIIKKFGFSLTHFPFSRYFSEVFESQRAGEILEENRNSINGEGQIDRIAIRRVNDEKYWQKLKILLEKLLDYFSRGLDRITALIISIFTRSLMAICIFRIGILALNGAMDFIPAVGWAIGGVIAYFINIPFTKKIGNKTIQFCSNLIRQRGGREVIMNQIEGYRNAINFLNNLNLRERWERKVLKIND